MVYVISKDGQPLMPTKRCGKVYRLLKNNKAKVIRRCPFTIKLLYEPESFVVQEVNLGVDTGSKHVGVSAVGNDEVLYASEIELRDDIKSKMDARRTYRRNRRQRKTRYRKPGFLNRAKSAKLNRLPPSVKSKVESHIREIEFVNSILPVSNIILEVSQFDTALMKNPLLIREKVKHWGYQKGLNYGYESRKEAVLHRDNYACQICGKKHTRLEVHHIVFRSQGGTDEEDNLITLCEDCHHGIHNGTVVLKKKPRKLNLKFATQMSIIRSQLLKKYPEAIETFGFITKANRYSLDLEKTHYNDASVIASAGKSFTQTDEIFYKKNVADGDFQKTKGIRSEQPINTAKIAGFKKFDKVHYQGGEYFIKGRMSTGYAVLMDIFGEKQTFENPKTVKLSECKRMTARCSTLTQRTAIHHLS